MGFNFHMRAVRPRGDGTVVPLEGSGTSFALRHNTLFELLDAVESELNRRDRTPRRKRFPWYSSCQGPDDIQYLADRCFQPTDVLASLHSVERELQRNGKKYPSSWLFWVSDPGGSKQSHPHLDVWYRSVPCRLFSDEQGVWARETSPGPRQGVHHDLKAMGQIPVQLAKDGPEVIVGLERVSLFTQRAADIAEMKRVCVTAVGEDALIMTSAG